MAAMAYPITLGLALALLPGSAGAVQAPGPPAGRPPAEADVIRALPPPAPGCKRDGLQIVIEEVQAGHWKGTACYREVLRLPWPGIALRGRVRAEVVYLDVN
jgi:hypothetical protein